MSVPRVGINGFGRIGRLIVRALLTQENKTNIVGINDLAPNEVLAHLFQFDSIHGKFNGTVEVTKTNLIINGKYFSTWEEEDPINLPWEELNTDFVIESTGLFRTRDNLEKHIYAGGKKVILCAPPKNRGDVDITVIRGINVERYNPSKHEIISNASTTTNCLAIVMKILDDAFGFEHGNFSTVHAYTNDQRLLDSKHEDKRRMRTAGINFFPTSSGAEKSINSVLPHLANKVVGHAIRIPVPNVSLLDLTARLKHKVKIDDVIEAFRNAENSSLKGIIQTESRELVSSDYIGNPHSAIIDIPTLKVIDANQIKVLAWYDNEWGYANRIAELVHELHMKNGN